MRLFQVFQNLMVNAINYSGDAPPHIEISAESSDSEHRFAVSDERDRHRARTLRAHIHLKRLHGKDVPGSGIGLALCRKIVEGHGGTIVVDSQSGQGSRFLLCLPLGRILMGGPSETADLARR